MSIVREIDYLDDGSRLQSDPNNLHWYLHDLLPVIPLQPVRRATGTKAASYTTLLLQISKLKNI